MRILVACEESQTITKEIRLLGFEAFSCDIKQCSGDYPEWHIIGDALEQAYNGRYDMMIAHPPCTYLAVSGAAHLYNKDKTKNIKRWENRRKALDFVRDLMNAPIRFIAIENPVSCISTEIRKPDCIVQPYHFGDEAQKTTCWWLKNLPPLRSTSVVSKGEMKEYFSPKSGTMKKRAAWLDTVDRTTNESRQTQRSKTFPGMAKAIAEQWTKAAISAQYEQLELF